MFMTHNHFFGFHACSLKHLPIRVESCELVLPSVAQGMELDLCCHCCAQNCGLLTVLSLKPIIVFQSFLSPYLFGPNLLPNNQK